MALSRVHKGLQVSLLLLSFPKLQHEKDNKIICLNKTVQSSLNKGGGRLVSGLCCCCCCSGLTNRRYL